MWLIASKHEISNEEYQRLLEGLQQDPPWVDGSSLEALGTLAEDVGTSQEVLDQIAMWIPVGINNKAKGALAVDKHLRRVWGALINRGAASIDSEVARALARRVFPIQAFGGGEHPTDDWGQLDELQARPAEVSGNYGTNRSAEVRAALLLAEVPGIPAEILERMALWWVPGHLVQVAICDREDADDALRSSVLATWLVGRSLLAHIGRTKRLKRTPQVFACLSDRIDADSGTGMINVWGIGGHMLDQMLWNAWGNYSWSVTFDAWIRHNPNGLSKALEQISEERTRGIPAEAWMVLAGSDSSVLRQLAWLEMGHAPDEGVAPKRWVVPKHISG